MPQQWTDIQPLATQWKDVQPIAAPATKAPPKFESDVMRGMGLDPAKVAAAGGAGAQWKEVGRQALTGAAHFGASVAKDPFHILDPIHGMATNIEQAIKERSPGMALGAAATVAMGMEAPEVTKVKAGNAVGAFTRTLMDRGPSREAAEAAVHAHGLDVKAGLSTLKDKARLEQSAAQDAVSKTVDATNPTGVNGQSVLNVFSNSVAKKSLIPENLPPSLKKLEMVAKQYTDTLGGPKQITAWSFEQAKQIRTEVGEDLYGTEGRFSGQVYSVLKDVRESLTNEMQTAADKAGQGQAWTAAKKLTQDYRHAFDGVWEAGKFTPSPIHRALQEQTGSGVMESLGGENAQLTRNTMAKYQRLGADLDKMKKDMRAHDTIQSLERLSRPTVYNTILLGVAVVRPEWGIPMLLARYIAPRTLRGMATRSLRKMTKTP